MYTHIFIRFSPLVIISYFTNNLIIHHTVLFVRLVTNVLRQDSCVRIHVQLDDVREMFDSARLMFDTPN